MLTPDEIVKQLGLNWWNGYPVKMILKGEQILNEMNIAPGGSELDHVYKFHPKCINKDIEIIPYKYYIVYTSGYSSAADPADSTTYCCIYTIEEECR